MTQGLIGITQDSAIIQVQPPLASAVDAFAENGTHGPKLKPLQFAFDRPWMHTWNQEITEKLVNQFTRQEDVAESEMETLYDLCRQRFDVLRTLFRRGQPRQNEDEVARRGRLWDDKMRVASMKRKNTRRQTVSPVCLYEFMVTYRSVQLFDDRFAIASINSEDGRDVLWTFVAKVVASFGSGGMRR